MKSDSEESPVNTKLRTYAILAIGCVLLNKLTSYIILSSHPLPRFALDFYLNSQSIIFYWVLPVLIVFFIENRNLESLGLTSGRLSISTCMLLAVLVILLPIAILGFNRSVILHVLEQILFIAFAEEVMWRGYFQKRLSDWIGAHRGIFITSILFGLGHIVSIYAVEGQLIPGNSITTFIQTTMGGLIFGYIFFWTKSIWPGACLHLVGNVFF